LKPGSGKTDYERSETRFWANSVYTLEIATQYQFQPGSGTAPEGAMRSEVNCILAANGHPFLGSVSGRMSLTSAVSIGLLNLAALPGGPHGQSPQSKIIAPVGAAETGASAGLSPSASQVPSSFEANQGRTDPQVRILSRANGYRFFLNETAARE
jgi:hypothetical protein